MDVWHRLNQSSGALYWILRDARTAHSERECQVLRWRIRMLGLSATDTAICLGLLADVVGDELEVRHAT